MKRDFQRPTPADYSDSPRKISPSSDRLRGEREGLLEAVESLRSGGCRTATCDDEELKQRVCLFLASSSLPALRHLLVDVEGDIVLLSGSVQTYHEKQLAIEFARRVAGVIRVVDMIEVRGYVPRTDEPRTDHWRQTSLEPSAPR